MKYSELAVFATLVLASFGDLPSSDGTHLQEDCCGAGALSAAVRAYGMRAARRDVSCMKQSGVSKRLLNLEVILDRTPVGILEG